MDQNPDPRKKHTPDGERPKGRGTMPFNPRTLMVWPLIIIAVLIAIMMMGDRNGTDADKYTLDKLYTDLAEGVETPIERIEWGDGELTVEMKKQKLPPGSKETKRVMPLPERLMSDVMKVARQHNSEMQVLRAEGKPAPPDIKLVMGKGSMVTHVLLMAVPWVLPLLLLFFIFRQMRSAGPGASVLAFGKSRAKLMNKSTGVTFADVAGIEEAKEDVMEVIEFLRNPERFERLGGRMPRGILLVGPPGTGKTLLAKAIAGEAERPFFSISGSDFVEMFVGVGASRVRDLFHQAKENSPSIIFLDEIDAVGRRRGTGLGGGHDEREQTLNAILVEMDGFETDARVILIAATNRPDVLDPALLRPGRFDRQVVVDMPDVRGREAILRVKAENIKLDNLDDLKMLARGTTRCAGADLENILNESAILAVLNDHDAVMMSDLEEARDKVLWGRAKKSKVVAEHERRIGALHEAGHAVMAALLEHCDPLHKVTIIPRGMAGGMTMILPKEDTYLLPKQKLIDQITMGLAGRVAEEVFCDDITSGAQGDLETVTETARMMVCRWGMDEALGTISYAEREEHLFLGREITRTRNVSEATALKIDNAIRKIIDDCYKRCHRMVEENRDKIERVAMALLEHELLDAESVSRLMEGKPLKIAGQGARDVQAGVDGEPLDQPAVGENTAEDSETTDTPERDDAPLGQDEPNTTA